MKIQAKTALLYFAAYTSTKLLVQSNLQTQPLPELRKHSDISNTHGKQPFLSNSFNSFVYKLSPYNMHRRMQSTGSGGTKLWVPLGDFITGDAEFDEFGVSVAMSDDGQILAIGARTNDDEGDNSGHVKVYQFNDEWRQVGDDIVGKTAGEWFGYRLDMSGDGSRIAIGGYGANSTTGVVRVYENKGGIDNWIQVGDDISGGDEYDSFGRALSMSNDGTTIAIGANLDEEEDGILLNTGGVQVYHEDSGSWTQVGSRLLGQNSMDRFGYGVSLAGNALTVAVGAPTTYSTAGYVQLYKFQDNASNEKDWVKFGYDVDGHPDGDYFGTNVALSGNGQYLGVSGFDHRYVKVYKISGNQLVKVGKDFFVENSGSYATISLSYDGRRLIIGDQRNDEFGLDAGRAQVFELVGEEWEQVGSNLYPMDSNDTLVEDHYFGSSVSMSRDGSTVAVGARRGDLNGKTDSGHVRVYRMFESPSRTPSNKLAFGLLMGLIAISVFFVLHVGFKRGFACCNKGSVSKDQNEIPVGSPVVDGDVEII